MRYAILGMLLLFALGDGCSPTPNVVGVQDYGRITGRVLDAMTNKPIPNALVSVGSLYTTSADARGAFTLMRVPVGDQTLTARAPGYDYATADATVLKDQAVEVGYVRLVPVIHPEGQATLPPPPTPTPVPSPSPSSSPVNGALAPAASGSPTPTPLPSPAPAGPVVPEATATP
jgi:Carboxypeptidase regulatory-like domain